MSGAPKAKTDLGPDATSSPGTPAPVVESRATRRKRETEARLLDAGLRVFCERGYDATTTGEIARVADVAAGTFYVHFRDKRAIYERLAGRTAREIQELSLESLRPEMTSLERVAVALRIAADYWRSDLERARLLLEGGPSLGSEGHVAFVEEIAQAFTDAPDLAGQPPARAHSLALLAAGMGIEIGRLIVARPEATQEAQDLIRLVGGLYQS